MIGSLLPHSKKVTIVGAGLSGLILAHQLKRGGFDVRIIEASDRIGGLVRTIKTPLGPAETAAHSLMVTPAVESFFDSLGVALCPVSQESKARYIYRNKKMRKMPLTFFEFLVTLKKFFSSPKNFISIEKMTLSEFCETYLGKPALDFLLTPFVTGIFAASPSELNLSITFPKLVPKNPSHSLFKNLFLNKTGQKKAKRPEMMAPVYGMESVVTALGAMLEDSITLNRAFTKDDLEHFPKDENLVLALPAHNLASLIEPMDLTSSQLLSKVKYSPLVTATVFIKTDQFLKIPKGVGVLVPQSEKIRVLGVLFNSSAFPNRVQRKGFESFTVMLGGTRDPGVLELSDESIHQTIKNDLSLLFGQNINPELIILTRWQRAIPLYNEALKMAQMSLNQGFCKAPGRIVFSNYSKEVSIRGMIETAATLT